MVAVQFEEEQINYYASKTANKGMAGFLIKNSGGLVRTHAQANVLLVLLALIMLTVALFLFINSTSEEIDSKYLSISDTIR